MFGGIYMKDDRIIRKVKSLLRVAEGNANVEESHTAFMQAQRMMIKYHIDPSEVTEQNEIREVLEKSGSNYKRLFWWERKLANIVARNFRCKFFTRSDYVDGKSQIQRKIVFMGIENDVELANEMYKLVVEAILFYTNRYIKMNNISGVSNRGNTMQVKNDYMKGFIDGLESKFEEQIEMQEWGLVLVVPKDVVQKFEETVTGKSTYRIPSVQSKKHFQKGYEDGNAIDYKKETIDEKPFE